MECDFDKKTIEDFVSMVREIAEDVYRKMSAKSEGYYNGFVVGVNEDNSTATVQVDDIILNDLPNKTGEVLEEKSFVRVYTTSSSMIDAYIGVKLN